MFQHFADSKASIERRRVTNDVLCVCDVRFQELVAMGPFPRQDQFMPIRVKPEISSVHRKGYDPQLVAQ
jgi:hypothetical protein